MLEVRELAMRFDQRVLFTQASLTVANGEIVGRVSSGGLGYSLNASIAYAWLPVGASAPGTAVSVEVFGESVPAEVRADPLYDPTGARLRG